MSAPQASRGATVPDPVRKRPGSVASTGRRSFKAQYGGACVSCGAVLLPGDDIFYAPGNEGASGLDCCGDRPDEELTVTQRRDVGIDDEDMTVDAAKVMPHGRTAKDACGRCFQVPSSNGVCGCDY